jgi:hypothetical protein
MFKQTCLIAGLLVVGLSQTAQAQATTTAEKDRIRVMFLTAKEYHDQGQHAESLSKLSEIDSAMNMTVLPTVQNLRIKNLVAQGRFQDAKSALDKLYGLSPTQDVVKDMIVYEPKILSGIEAEKAAAVAKAAAAAKLNAENIEKWRIWEIDVNKSIDDSLEKRPEYALKQMRWYLKHRPNGAKSSRYRAEIPQVEARIEENKKTAERNQKIKAARIAAFSTRLTDVSAKWRAKYNKGTQKNLKTKEVSKKKSSYYHDEIYVFTRSTNCDLSIGLEIVTKRYHPNFNKKVARIEEKGKLEANLTSDDTVFIKRHPNQGYQIAVFDNSKGKYKSGSIKDEYRYLSKNKSGPFNERKWLVHNLTRTNKVNSLPLYSKYHTEAKPGYAEFVDYMTVFAEGCGAKIDAEL